MRRRAKIFGLLTNHPDRWDLIPSLTRRGIVRYTFLSGRVRVASASVETASPTSSSATTPTAGTRPAPGISLRAPALAALLGFLVPGLGHLFQGRIFKGCLFLVCILGTFYTGLRVGDFKVVYLDTSAGERRTWAYAFQMCVGLPALPAIAQARFRSPEAYQSGINGPMSAPFSGQFSSHSTPQGQVRGVVTLQPESGPEGYGTLVGDWILSDGTTQPIEWKVVTADISRRVAPDPNRSVSLGVMGPAAGGRDGINGQLEGAIPRPFWDRYGAPLRDSKYLADDANTDLEAAHFTLGTRFELGVVYTMIAGLLNILAVYDALEGPAYAEEEAAEEEALRASRRTA